MAETAAARGGLEAPATFCGDPMHIGLVYREFEKLMRAIETGLVGDMEPRLGYSGEVLQARLLQRIVEVILIPYVHQVQQRIDDGLPPFPTTDAPLRLGGLIVDPRSGRVRVSTDLLIRSLADFLKYWILTIWFSVMASREPQCRRAERFAVVFGVGRESIFRHGSDIEFATYCRLGPIRPLNDCDWLMIESAEECASSDPRIVYRKRPLLALLASMNLPWRQKAGLILKQFSALAQMLVFTMKRSPIAALARDLAFLEPVLMAAQHTGICECIYTNTHYLDQPLWTRTNPRRRFAVHMVWYSQNIVPVVFRSDRVKTDIPNYRYLRVDEHWVWTDRFARYLTDRELPGVFHVVGPVLWYLPDRNVAPLPARNKITIACFDVTPVLDKFAHDLGLIGNYYSARNAKAFLEGVAGLADYRRIGLERPLRILLKHKRGHGTHHDPEYPALIEKLQSSGIPLEILPSETSIYSILEHCDLVIVIPYSSPACIAAMLGVPAIFFDPTSRLLPSYDEHDNIHFAGGFNELARLAKHLLTGVK